MDEIARGVFRSRHRFPGAKITRAETVLEAARALRGIGVDVLQDVAARRPAEVGDALHPLPGLEESTVRMLLMFTGDEDFVLETTMYDDSWRAPSAAGRSALPRGRISCGVPHTS